MKKTIITLASASFLFSLASAQQFVAAWDFDGPGTANVGGGDGALDTNGDFSLDANDFVSADYAGSGLFSWSGLDTNASGFEPNIINSNNLDDVVGGVTTLGVGFSFKVAANPDAGGSFTISGLDFTGLENANLSFGALVQNFDGSATVNVGSTAVALSGADTEYNVDISALDGLAAQSIVFTFSNFSTIENMVFDNFQITAAVPEPSSFAALAGALALGIVAMRRRK